MKATAASFPNAWDFGEGATGSGVTTSHTSNTARTYTVALTVTDDDGLGVTWGYRGLRAIDQEGNPAIRHGKYVTAWKKDAEGKWK